MATQVLFQNIIKRNGELADFDSNRIEEAIFKAMQAISCPNRPRAKCLTNKVIDRLYTVKGAVTPNIEQIQDTVEVILFEEENIKLLKAYMLYRKQREQARDTNELLKNVQIIDKYLNLNDWRVKESANSSYSLQGLNQHISSIITSQYWLKKLYSDDISDLHYRGYLHIHDLGVLAVYCVGWDLQDLLLTGFKGVEGKIESKPAKHFRSALGQIVNFFYTLQGEAAGAQAFSNFDTLLAPYIRFDNLCYSDIKQCIQEFLFNINIPTRVGFQTPFTNITLDLTVPEHLKNEPAVWGGKTIELVYGDFQEEITMINKAFAEAMLEGDANGRLFSFPIPTYNITKDFDWDNPNYELIWEMTAKYGIPYFSNFINSDLSPDDVRSMCCRLRLDKRELSKRGGGLFASNPLTGSIGVVTINLPKLGYEAKTSGDFYAKLREIMTTAKNSLEIKRKVIERYTALGLYPYSKYYLRHLYQANNSYWKNHFSTIGIVGMNECCANLFGGDLSDRRSIKFALQTMEFMKSVLQEFQEETGNIYNLEATPAESTSYRFAKIDIEQYPNIITANQDNKNKGAAPYYTNSSHLPVNYSDDIFDTLTLQDDLQSQYTGGTVLHLFTGEKNIPSSGVKNMIRKITSNFKLPYITITPTFSVCRSHGYISGEYFNCPICGDECEVYSRIVGYIRPVKQWNAGKQQEFTNRKTFSIEKA